MPFRFLHNAPLVISQNQFAARFVGFAFLFQHAAIDDDVQFYRCCGRHLAFLRQQARCQHDLLADAGLPVPPGDAISRFREDPPAITMGSMDGVCDLIGRGVFAVVGGVVMWRIDPVLTVAAFAPVALAALISDGLGTRASRYGAAALASTTTLTRFLGELVTAQLAVRVAGAERRVVDRLSAIGEMRRRMTLRMRASSSRRSIGLVT